MSTTKTKITTPAAALVAAIDVRDRHSAALDRERLAVAKILASWDAGDDSATSADKRQHEDEIVRLTRLLTAAERQVMHAQAAVEALPKREPLLRALASDVASAVMDQGSFITDLPRGAYDETGKRYHVQVTWEATPSPAGTEVVFTGHPASAESTWDVPRIGDAIEAAALALHGEERPNLGRIGVQILSRDLVEDGASVPLKRDRLFVKGGFDGRVKRDAIRVRVRFATQGVESQASALPKQRTGVDPREHLDSAGADVRKHPGRK